MKEQSSYFTEILHSTMDYVNGLQYSENKMRCSEKLFQIYIALWLSDLSEASDEEVKSIEKFYTSRIFKELGDTRN